MPIAPLINLAPGLTRQYPGIIPIDCDGAIQQVSWRIGPGGPTTIASMNCEHSDYVPDLPARRLRENLAPNQAAAASNLVERAIIEKVLPKPK
jgi:hypothetical protein